MMHPHRRSMSAEIDIGAQFSDIIMIIAIPKNLHVDTVIT